MEETKIRPEITQKVLQRMDWSEISRSIQFGELNLSVGDAITDTLKDGREFNVEAAAISPYEENTIAFVFRDIVSLRSMNTEDTNKGGWCYSEVREWLNEEFIKLLPDSLAEVIKERTITQNHRGKRLVSSDKIWLPSQTEVFGNRYPADIGDIQFELFKNPRNRVKTSSDFHTWWWVRSPYCNYLHIFYCVNSSGDASYRYASCSQGIAPAFIL